ncbi:rCG36648 [Rattus norvegicus]|uniref:RCG36648 n=1 Tax=Rattus norvegicus TaxID=10116 RepID=A6JS23_RAT|nr:rCG36648 [Rattus norvegicus]
MEPLLCHCQALQGYDDAVIP